MYKKILCAVEPSKEGAQVLAKAAAAAKLSGAELVVIHVIPYTFRAKDYQKLLVEEVAPKIEKMAAKYGVPKKHQLVKVGKPYEHICTQAERRKVDVVFIGTHSKKGLNALLGSTARGVANYATCDVSLVKL